MKNRYPYRTVMNPRLQRAVHYCLLLLITLSMILAGTRCSPSSPDEELTASGNQETPHQEASPAPTRASTLTPTYAVDIDLEAPAPPRLVSWEPGIAYDIPLNAVFDLVFDQPMNPESIMEALVLTIADNGEKITPQIQWPEENTLRISFKNPLLPDTNYTLTIDQQAIANNNLPLGEDIHIGFKTLSALKINQVFPSDTSESVDPNTPITIIFNRPVVPLTIGAGRDILPDILEFSPQVTGKGEWVSTSVYTFQPDPALKSGTSYSAAVRAGLQASDGSPETSLLEDSEWQFTTLSPYIIGLTIEKKAAQPDTLLENIPLSPVFTFKFSQPMESISTIQAISLTDTRNNALIPLEATTDDNLEIITFEVERPLELDHLYSIEVSQSALAADGGQLIDFGSWLFKTVPAPAIEYTFPENGSLQETFYNNLEVQFASKMNLESLEGHIVISPEPEGGLRQYYNSYRNTLNFYGLEPSTTYTVDFLPGMQDIYNNTITSRKTIRFATTSRSPRAYLVMPTRPALLRSDGPHEIFTRHVNIDSMELSLYRISPETFLHLNDNWGDRAYFAPKEDSTLVWQTSFQSEAQTDEVFTSKYDLNENGDTPLSPGFYLLGMKADPIEYTGVFLENRLLIVSSANLTLKLGASEALVWLTDFETGRPLDNIPVNILNGNYRKIATGMTDDRGLALIELPTMTSAYEDHYAIAGIENLVAFTNSDWSSGNYEYDYTTYSKLEHSPNTVLAYLYTDRPLYRPGQPVYYKGIIRIEDDVEYRLPDRNQAEVLIYNYEGDMISQHWVDLSEYGTFDGQFELDNDAALGSYSITARLVDEEDVSGWVEFSVAEYRRLQFTVDVTAPESDILLSDKMNFDIQADYLAGGAVGGAKVNWTLGEAPYFYIPDDEELARYRFADDEIIEETYRFEPQANAEGEAETDETGSLEFSLPLRVKNTNFGRTLTLEATITDLAGNQVSSRDTIIAHPASYYVGVRPENYIGTAGEDQVFELVVVNNRGLEIPEYPITVDIIEKRWHSVQVQDSDGYIHWESTVEEIPIESFDEIFTREDGTAAVSFTPPSGGYYVARASVRDHRENQARASASMWVSGSDYVPWQQYDHHKLDLILDRESYAVGDTADIMIASPFQGDAYALVTIERSRLRRWEVIPIENNSTRIQIPITEDMAPNAFISVLIIKGIDSEGSLPDHAIGLAEIKVDTRQKQIHVIVTPDQEEAGPRQTVTFTVQTTAYNEKPISAEVSLSLSDLATLLLKSSSTPPLLDFFYSERLNEISTSVPLDLLLEDFNTNIEEDIADGEGMGSGGGGKGEGLTGVMQVRQNFPDTAYWNARVLTDKNGKATIEVRLPDNLTTWRMDARAVTIDTNVGQTTIDLLSSKPLLLRPQTPRFFVEGDQAVIGTAVHNRTEENLTTIITLDASGLEVEDGISREMEFAAGEQIYVSWQVTVPRGSQRADMIFSVEGGDYSDATRPPMGTLDNQGIPIYRYEAPETAGTSGVLENPGSQAEIITLPAGLVDPGGKLTIQMSPSLAAGLNEGLDYLEHYPYECIEQTVSRFLPNIRTVRVLQAAGITDDELYGKLEEQINFALQRLYSFQNNDGGWGWWENQESSSLTTAYVVLGLVEAAESDFPVDESILNHAISYLVEYTTKVNTEVLYTRNRTAFIYYILARAGAPRISASSQLYEERLGLSLYARGYLAQAIALADPDDPRLLEMLSELGSEAIISASGVHWEEETLDYWNWNTDLRTTAVILSTFIALDPDSDLNPGAVRWLMSNRTAGRWRSTQETAWTLMALTDWLEVSGELEADYYYALGLNGERLKENHAKQETIRQSETVVIDLEDLLLDEPNRLIFAREDGPGILYYTAHLQASLPVEDLEPIDRGFVITRQYFTLDNPDEPVTQAQWGDLLLARLTVIAPHDLHYIVIDDPLPAGLEAVDQSLDTSVQQIEPDAYSWEDVWRRGWGWWYFRHVEMRDEKIVLSADSLPAGTYIYTYLVRAGTPGTFQVIPPTGQEFYFPDVYGRGAGSTFDVLQ